MTKPRITFVKKILADGSPCAKCRDVEARLEAGNHFASIDRVVVADERNLDSAGMRLAASLKVDRAPFFIVETDEKTVVYTVFLKFLKEILQAADASEDAQLLLAANPELDLL